MILVGIDDTDTIDTPGTNQLARAIAARVAERCRCLRIVRHQLLDDARVPCTSKNGSASLLFESESADDVDYLIRASRAAMQAWFVEGSDPGLCVAQRVSERTMEFGRRCQRELVDQAAAMQLAADERIHLEGLGGTNGGVIGALAAVGLAACRDDGRVVQLDEWPDDLSGSTDFSAITERGIEVRRQDSGERITQGVVDVGKHLRPNIRDGRIMLFVDASDSGWKAVRLT